MTPPPTFVSEQEYVSRRGDAGFWWPYLSEIVERHALGETGPDPVAGAGPTYPTFLWGEVVVKLFGYRRWWRQAYAAERAAHAVLETDPLIAAPRLLVHGQLFEDADAPWPYLVSERMTGIAWDRAGLTVDQRLSVAAEVGRTIRRAHALRPMGIALHEAWPDLDVTAAARQSALPAQLVGQIDAYLTRIGPFDPVFVNGDMIDRHVYVENGRLAGIIDWGDAIVTDRHYELAKLHLDTFDGDKALLRAFLAASDWPVDEAFAHKALGQALYRQAYGLVQHQAMDVFHKVSRQVPLSEIETLEQLAAELFAV